MIMQLPRVTAPKSAVAYRRARQPSRTTSSPSDRPPPTLSPRALEKRPARDVDVEVERSPAKRRPRELHLPLRAPEATHQADERGARRSFFDGFLARPPPRSHSTSHVLNPINYVPRPTPIKAADRELTSTVQAQASGSRETRTLLTLPEQRRSRQNSPTTPIVEHGLHFDDSRSSIGLPPNLARSSSLDPEMVTNMGDNEKPKSDRIGLPKTRHPPQEQDLEANLPPSQAGLSNNNNTSRHTDLNQPPRRVSSKRSLTHQRSVASLRSTTYSYTTNTNRDHPTTTRPQSATVTLDDHATSDHDNDADDLASELAWGPSHPCFPHPNPHVPLTSPEHTTTRIIRVRRDWMIRGDLAPTFSNLYPEILDPLLPEQEFRRLLQHVNDALVSAYDPFSTSNWFDGILGVLTGWIWEDLRPGGVKGRLRKLEEWLERWNRDVGAREGVVVIPLRRTAYMSLDIQMPDPQVRVMGEGDTFVSRFTRGDGE